MPSACQYATRSVLLISLWIDLGKAVCSKNGRLWMTTRRWIRKVQTWAERSGEVQAVVTSLPLAGADVTRGS